VEDKDIMEQDKDGLVRLQTASTRINIFSLIAEPLRDWMSMKKVKLCWRRNSVFYVSLQLMMKRTVLRKQPGCPVA